MNRRTFRQRVQRNLPIVLLALLVPLGIVLAVMQYRWTAEVSSVEQERMRKDLTGAVTMFAAELQAAVTSPAMGYQMDAATWRARDWRSYAQGVQSWSAGEPPSPVVRAVLLLAADRMRLDLAAATFRPIADPEDLGAARDVESALAAWRGPDGSLSVKVPSMVLLPDVPAIVIPIRDSSEKADLAPAPGVVAVVLDADAIEAQVLPRLLARYLADPGLLRDYRVEVVRAGGTVVYSNDLRWNPVHGNGMIVQADAVATLLSMKPLDPLLAPKEFAAILSLPAGSETSEVMVRLVRKLSTQAAVGAAVGGVATMQYLALPGGLSVQSVKPQSQHAAEPGDAETRPVLETQGLPGQKGSVSVSAGANVAWSQATIGSGWTLIASHRTGSVEALVRQHRSRNIAVGSGILAVLLAGLAVSALSARRARLLARRERDFITGVTHELKTPVAAILSAGENISDGLVTERRRIEEYGHIIVEEGRRLLGMVEKVLGYAVVERHSTVAGGRAAGAQPVDMRAMLEAACASVEPECRRRGIELELSLAAELPVVHGDPDSLRSAVQNLLTNAVIHAGDGRWIRVSAGARAASSGRELVVQVEDHGPGIERGELARVFEPFYRGRRAVAAQVPGTGIGLSLARSIAESHGGRLEVASAPGRGACFTLTVGVR